MSALALLLLALAPSGDPTVTVETIEGRPWWSVRAQDAPVGRVLDLIARRSGRRLEGTDELDPATLVTVELDRRPLEQVLEYVAGTAGAAVELRTDALVLYTPGTRSAAALMADASAAWVRASTRFPGDPLAAGARLAQGELAELRGDGAAAREHYDALVETYPGAQEVTEATMRVARLLERQGQWAEASLRFRALARADVTGQYAPLARIELARCSIELGDPQTALHMLAALDSDGAALDPSEVAGRELVRADALNALQRPMEALRALESVDWNTAPLARTRAMRARARALDGLGLHADAARAWLLYGSEASGSERALALREAARLSLVADDELGVLFVVREAERSGASEDLGPYWHQARVRLGLEPPESAQGDVASRLSNAEAMLARGEAAQAAVVLEPMFLGRGALDPRSGLRLLLAWADAQHQRFGVDQALRLLAQERAAFDEAGARSAIDAFAARLLEREGLYDRAVDAYEGRY